LEGKEADSRTDIFAFGAVVYEMATGKKAFEGKSQASLIAAIMGQDPRPMAELQPMTPARLDHIVRRCMAKEPDRRWQTASDVMEELRWVTEVGTPVDSLPAVAGPVWKRAIPWSITAAVMVIAGWALWSPTVPTSKPLTKTIITTPDNAPLANNNTIQAAISPDGRKIVYQALVGGNTQLYLRQLDDLGVTPLSGTEGAEVQFFSPDGESVAFFTADALKKVSLRGGAAITLSSFPGLGFRGSWGPDDTIVFAVSAEAPDSPGPPGLYRVSANGGEPEGLAFPDTDKGECGSVPGDRG
jgi:serine/threonine-protein kinase